MQVLNGHPYNRKCDVYSFGICLWEVYCCDMPYPDLSFSEVTSAVVRQVRRQCFPAAGSSSFLEASITETEPYDSRDVRTEPEARDTALLPELAGERDEAVLGREPGQAARDGGGRVHAGGDRHVQGRRHDPDGPDAGLLLLPPPVPRPLTLLRPGRGNQ